jgi:hypothetical protein
VREQNADGEREQPDAAKVDRDNALRGGTPSCEQKITVKNGTCLATMRRSATRV